MLAPLLLTVAIGTYACSLLRTRDLLNPAGIAGTSWFAAAALASTALGVWQHPWDALTLAVVVVAGAALVLGIVFGSSLLPLRRSPARPSGGSAMRRTSEQQVFFRCYHLIFLIALGCVLLEWRANGFAIPLLSGGADAKADIVGIPVVHYGSILMPYCGIVAVYELLVSPRRAWAVTILLTSTAFYGVVIYVSRGSLLITALGALYVYHRTRGLRPVFLIGALIAGVTAFLAMSLARMASSSIVNSAMQVDNPWVRRAFSPIYVYVTYGFENLRALVSNDPPWTYGLHAFQPLLYLVGLVERGTNTFEVPLIFNQVTLVYGFYMDLGIVGVALGALVIGLIVGLIYARSLTDPTYVPILAMLQKAIWVPFFGNYFTGDLSQIFPLVVAMGAVLVGHAVSSAQARWIDLSRLAPGVSRATPHPSPGRRPIPIASDGALRSLRHQTSHPLGPLAPRQRSSRVGANRSHR